MKARVFPLLFVACACGAAAVACVDLFHATDFPTLCDLDASACGDTTTADAAGPLDLCTPLPAERAKAVCAHLGACLGGVGTTLYGECLVLAQLAYDCEANPAMRPIGDAARRWSCLANAKTCDAVSACVFPAGAQTCVPTPPEAGTYEACGNSVNAETLVECGSFDKPVSVEPCGLANRTCTTIDPARNRGACTGKGGNTCSSGVRRCEGTAAVSCEALAGGGTRDVGIDCAAIGAGHCVETNFGPACAPDPEASPCATSTGAACVDGLARACVDRRWIHVYCTRLGLSCLEPDERAAWNIAGYCTGSSDCDPKQPDTCEGDRLVGCKRGTRVELDCASVGLGPCRVQTNGSGACTAR